MRSPKRNGPSSYVKGISLLIILLLAFLLYQRITRNGLPSNISNLISNEFDTYRNFKELDESKKTELKKQFAGFWVYQTADSNAPVQKWDHLELRDNGIIWQVTSWFIELPSGDTASFLYARTAYMNPFGKIPDMDKYGCDVRILRQTFISGSDTCYGASQIDQMWQVRMDGDDLMLNRKRYVHYNGEIQNFFPPGDIDVVDMLIEEECYGASLQGYAKDLISRKLKRNSPIPFNSEAVKQWITQYYKPAVIDEILESFSPVSPLPDSIQVEFGLSGDGHVVDPRLKSAIMINSKFNEMIIAEIGTWSFPRITDKKSAKVMYTFQFKNN